MHHHSITMLLSAVDGMGAVLTPYIVALRPVIWRPSAGTWTSLMWQLSCCWPAWPRTSGAGLALEARGSCVRVVRRKGVLQRYAQATPVAYRAEHERVSRKPGSVRRHGDRGASLSR